METTFFFACACAHIWLCLHDFVWTSTVLSVILIDIFQPRHWLRHNEWFGRNYAETDLLRTQQIFLICHSSTLYAVNPVGAFVLRKPLSGISVTECFVQWQNTTVRSKVCQILGVLSSRCYCSATHVCQQLFGGSSGHDVIAIRNKQRKTAQHLTSGICASCPTKFLHTVFALQFYLRRWGKLNIWDDQKFCKNIIVLSFDTLSSGSSVILAEAY